MDRTPWLHMPIRGFCSFIYASLDDCLERRITLLFFYFYPLAVNSNNDFMLVTEFPANSKNKVTLRWSRLPRGRTSMPEM